MDVFRLVKCPAKIRTKSQLLAQGTRGDGKKATEVELILEIDPTDCMRATESLFAGATDYLKHVASKGEDFKGEDRNARTKLPEMRVEIFYGDDAEPVLYLPLASVKARVQLKVSQGKKAEAKIIVKPRGKFSEKDLVAMVQLLEADIRVSMEPAQTDIGEDEFVAQGKAPKKEKEPKIPKEKGKKGAKPALVYDSNKGLVNGDKEAAH